MADNSRTIQVTGLPVDMVENRLIDKIQVHFLRKKNNGGEIQSVTVSKTTPGTAFITFEKSEVAVRLAEGEKQMFKVKDRIYEINISLHHEQYQDLDPDTVLLQMSIVVDHSKLPEGKETLLSLHQSYPRVHLTFRHEKNLFTLKGPYSEVQSLISLLLGSAEIKKHTLEGRRPPRSDCKEKNNSPLKNPTSRIQPNEEIKHGSLSDVQDLQHENEHWNSGFPQLSSFSTQLSYNPIMEHKKVHPEVHPEPLTSFEEFSLVVDSDIFQYLQKYSVKEYEYILRQNEVEVLDINCGDITTLYLQPKKALSDQGITSVIKAHQDMVHLYEVKESQLRKEQLSKSVIPTKDIDHTLELLRMKLPMLMIDEDKDNVYIVGSKSDVSEAKQFIMNVSGVRTDKHIQSDHLFGLSQTPFKSSKQKSSTLFDYPDIFQPVGNQLQNSDEPFKDPQTTSTEEILNYSSSDESKNIFSVRMHGGISEERRSFSDIQRTESAGPFYREKCTESIIGLQYTSNHNEKKPTKYPSSAECESFPMGHLVPCGDISVSSKDLKNKASKKSGQISEDKQTNDSAQDIFSIKRHESIGYTQVDKYMDSAFISSKDMENMALQKPNLSSGDKQTSCSSQDIFTVRTCDVTSEIESGGSADACEYTNTQDLDKKKSYIKEAQAEKKKSTRGNKTKLADSSRERKMAANLGDRRLGQDDNLTEDSSEHVQPHFLFVNKNPSPIILPGRVETSPNQLPKGDLTGQYTLNHNEKKPLYPVKSQSFFLGHMALSGDVSIKPNPNAPALRRSNSFSGKVKPRQTEQANAATVKLSPTQKGLNLETFHTKPVFTHDVVVSCQLWVYIKLSYITEVDSLMSDLQVNEIFEKRDIILHLKGTNSEKVNKCYKGLKSLIARVKTDFDERTILLSTLGVKDCTDEILMKFCTTMKQKHDKVKIVVQSKNLFILGPKQLCENVESTMMEVFQTRVKSPKTSMETKFQKPSEAESLTNFSSKTTTVIQDPSTMSDQTSAYVSNKASQSLKGHSRDPLLKNDKDCQEEGNQDVKKNTKQPPLNEGELIKQESLKDFPHSETPISSSSDDESNDKSHEQHNTSRSTLPKTKVDAYTQKNEAYIDHKVSEPIRTHQPDDLLRQNQRISEDQTSHFSAQYSSSGTLDLLCSVCKTEHSTVHHKPCGYKFCSQCEKSHHISCKTCLQASKQDTAGIKGSIFLRESTVTIPGFTRDTSIKIIYDIPNGIQGEDHPCPGAPFKGGRFEAFLPYNEDTKILLPLLKKAFHKSLTFTVQVKHSSAKGKEENQEAHVVWGSIPHKTSINGGISKNGFPDSSYIKHLTKALAAAGIEE